jgi:hypothetical protein
MFTRLSILLSIAAAVALPFAFDVVVWHALPRRFSVVENFAFWGGAIACFLAVVLAIVGLVRSGKSKATAIACACSVAEFLAFGFVYLYDTFSA